MSGQWSPISPSLASDGQPLSSSEMAFSSMNDRFDRSASSLPYPSDAFASFGRPRGYSPASPDDAMSPDGVVDTPVFSPFLSTTAGASTNIAMSSTYSDSMHPDRSNHDQDRFSGSLGGTHGAEMSPMLDTSLHFASSNDGMRDSSAFGASDLYDSTASSSAMPWSASAAADSSSRDHILVSSRPLSPIDGSSRKRVRCSLGATESNREPDSSHQRKRRSAARPAVRVHASSDGDDDHASGPTSSAHPSRPVGAARFSVHAAPAESRNAVPLRPPAVLHSAPASHRRVSHRLDALRAQEEAQDRLVSDITGRRTRHLIPSRSLERPDGDLTAQSSRSVPIAPAASSTVPLSAPGDGSSVDRRAAVRRRRGGAEPAASATALHRYGTHDTPPQHSDATIPMEDGSVEPEGQSTAPLRVDTRRAPVSFPSRPAPVAPYPPLRRHYPHGLMRGGPTIARRTDGGTGLRLPGVPVVVNGSAMLMLSLMSRQAGAGMSGNLMAQMLFDPDNLNTEQMMQLGALLGEVKSRGASDLELSRLPIHQYRSRAAAGGSDAKTESKQAASGASSGGGSSPLKECAVCLLEYEDGEDLMTLPCFHMFHATCAQQWLRSNKVCPVCKFSISDAGDPSVGEATSAAAGAPGASGAGASSAASSSGAASSSALAVAAAPAPPVTEPPRDMASRFTRAAALAAASARARVVTRSMRSSPPPRADDHRERVLLDLTSPRSDGSSTSPVPPHIALGSSFEPVSTSSWSTSTTRMAAPASMSMSPDASAPWSPLVAAADVPTGSVSPPPLATFEQFGARTHLPAASSSVPPVVTSRGLTQPTSQHGTGLLPLDIDLLSSRRPQGSPSALISPVNLSADARWRVSPHTHHVDMLTGQRIRPSPIPFDRSESSSMPHHDTWLMTDQAAPSSSRNHQAGTSSLSGSPIGNRHWRSDSTADQAYPSIGYSTGRHLASASMDASSLPVSSTHRNAQSDLDPALESAVWADWEQAIATAPRLSLSRVDSFAGHSYSLAPMTSTESHNPDAAGASSSTAGDHSLSIPLNSGPHVPLPSIRPPLSGHSRSRPVDLTDTDTPDTGVDAMSTYPSDGFGSVSMHASAHAGPTVNAPNTLVSASPHAGVLTSRSLRAPKRRRVPYSANSVNASGAGGGASTPGDAASSSAGASGAAALSSDTVPSSSTPPRQAVSSHIPVATSPVFGPESPGLPAGPPGTVDASRSATGNSATSTLQFTLTVQSKLEEHSRQHSTTGSAVGRSVSVVDLCDDSSEC